MKKLLHFFWFNYQKRHGDRAVYQYSNQEIQKWAEHCLQKQFLVHSASCETHGRVTQSKSDILIGHLTWDPHANLSGLEGKSQRNWMLDNRLNDDSRSHPNSYVLTPWVSEFPKEWTGKMPCLEYQLENAKCIFAICGQIWLDKTLALTDSSIQSRAKSKLIRLNMCVNYDALAIPKDKFNPRGQRKLIHVSNLGSYKGFELLLNSTEGVTVPSIGSQALGELKRGLANINIFDRTYAINNCGTIANEDEAQIRALVAEHDFYLHTSTMDAQATTILEFAARGLVPIITPESGFSSNDSILLTHDAEANKEIIQRALDMPEDELVFRSRRIREQIRREHSWERFFDTITENINRTCEN